MFVLPSSLSIAEAVAECAVPVGRAVPGFRSPVPKASKVPLPETLHPALWSAGRLARGDGRVLATGYDALNAELPGGGWPLGGLIELLCPQSGIGECRLLRPALSTLCMSARRIALVAPPYLPNAVRLVGWDFSPEQIVWVRAGESSDLLWAAEQLLRSQAFDGVLIWLNRARPGALRRLQVLAQAGESAIWVFRPTHAQRESSPAVLRLELEPAGADALSIHFHKRRGPLRELPLLLPLADPLRAGRASVRPLPVPPIEPFIMDPVTAKLLATLSSPSSSVAFDALSDASDSNTPDHAVLDRGTSAPSPSRRASTPVV
ncbi:translesion DNA synthesis-associated protein ImuA [Ralstonia pickettii]|uniref:translesion DNA synthesis-associated protein ImuA n=1 Tax=Ralstonia pickettii TaxID=329 RepID=UPI0027155676|nr:translesion DNA synthesis-associated protein ImuA [Ralstonia pickettii]WKZ87182.1 translesion DNA synthesis-associated protein ImuA [Ralstonia pickettii]